MRYYLYIIESVDLSILGFQVVILLVAMSRVHHCVLMLLLVIMLVLYFFLFPHTLAFTNMLPSPLLSVTILFPSFQLILFHYVSQRVRRNCWTGSAIVRN